MGEYKRAGLLDHLPLNKKLIMASVPIALFLVLFVQATAGELSLPSLPEAVQLLQLETIRGLKQTILEKEDKNRRLEEMFRSIEMEKEAVTLNNTMMKEELVRIISERDSVIGEMESRLQFLEKDGTIGQLEARIQGLAMEKAGIEREIVMVKEENALRMVAMESEKIQRREEFVKNQTERDSICQDEKSKTYKPHISCIKTQIKKFLEGLEHLFSYVIFGNSSNSRIKL